MDFDWSSEKAKTTRSNLQKGDLKWKLQRLSFLLGGDEWPRND
jgi:hypothetical protein